MARVEKCIITSSLEGKGAYGITVTDDQSVYFPVGVAEAAELEEFEQVEAILIANDRPEPAWKAIRVRRDSDGD